MMNATAKRYRRLYEAGRVDLTGLQRAAAKGLLAAADYEEITGAPLPTE